MNFLYAIIVPAIVYGAIDYWRYKRYSSNYTNFKGWLAQELIAIPVVFMALYIITFLGG